MDINSIGISVVHEPSGLESLGIQLLAARTGVHEPTRAPWRLEPAQTGVHEPTRLQTRASWQFLGGFLEARAGSSWLESRSGLGSSLESKVPRAEPA